MHCLKENFLIANVCCELYTFDPLQVRFPCCCSSGWFCCITNRQTNDRYFILCALTCFSIRGQTGVLGVLEQGQALLNGSPHVGLWTQQVRGSVLTLASGKDGEKKQQKESSHISCTRTLAAMWFSKEKGIGFNLIYSKWVFSEITGFSHFSTISGAQTQPWHVMKM